MMEKAKKRTSTRDQAIRKKFQGNSSPARSSKGSVVPKLSAKPGTVMAMYPTYPIILSQTETVVSVARAMAGNRTDAVLIVNNNVDQHLVGIVTDKDLAYRCVAEGLDALKTPVSVIMTKEPKHIRSDAGVDEAINQMLNGHFRHLPVVDDLKIVGLLDITKVMQNIHSKIDNSWGKAQALKTAFAEFQSSWQNFANNPEVEKWFDDWTSKMVEPDLASIMDPSAIIPEITFKTSVRDAAITMKDCRSTAVLVCDKDHDLGGIFTTKDICLRVLAGNELDPKSTSVVRVMTPHPDFGLDSMTIKAALKKMNGRIQFHLFTLDGHYLHLPVRSEKDGHILGLVDILGLTYSTMDLLMKQQALVPQENTLKDEKPGPMWSQFWSAADFETHEGSEPADESFDQGRQTRSSFGGLVSSGEYRARDVSESRASETSYAPSSDAFTFKFRDPFTGTIHKFAHVIKLEDQNTLLVDLIETMMSKCGYSLCRPKDDVQKDYSSLN